MAFSKGFSLVFSLFAFLPAFACENRVFSLSVQDYAISADMILNEFSTACVFSVIYDEAEIKERLEKKTLRLNFKDKSLGFVFDLLFDALNLHYTFNNDVLHLKLQDFKTFKLNYLSTARQGISNTAVSINNEDSLNSMQERISQSGIHITSEDGFNFWEDIAQEILALLHSSNSEDVVINRGAGLISVKGDRKSLQKVESYLKDLEARLQQQVLIDVQILSVRHSNAQSAGINWESLYDLQNVVLPAFSDSASFGGNGSVGNASGISLNGGSNGRNFQYGLNIFSAGVTLTRIIEFLKSYGEVRALSNPKVLTLNNQPALLSVGDILRYKKNNIFQNVNAQTTLT